MSDTASARRTRAKTPPERPNKPDVATLSKAELARELARMAADPDIQRVNAQIAAEFAQSERDGLD